MQILKVGHSFYNNIFFNKQDCKKRVSHQNFSESYLSPLKTDTVSFKGKNYSLDKIKEPTGHCAYCGEKVYSEEELESIATEIMKLKGARLTGKLRSILEKLDMPDTYTELAIQKRKTNKEHIVFFNKLSSYAQYSGAETGGELLLNYGNYANEQDVRGEIKSHLKPLLKTIDHITPQRKNNENSDEDINLVESCYACNHDLKRGMEFSEFNSIYPSIEKHMPPHKYQFALANVLENSGNEIKAEISSQNLLQLLETLSLQRSHAISTMDSIGLRFKKCFADIKTALESSKKEKSQKEAQIENLEKQKQEFYSIEEYRVRQRQSTLAGEISDLSAKKIMLTSAINRHMERLTELEADDPSVKSKKKKQMTQKEIEQKRDEILASIEQAKLELAETEKTLTEKEEEFQKSAKKYTPLSTVLKEKSDYDEILTAHDKYSENEPEEEVRRKELRSAESAIAKLEAVLNQPEPKEVAQADCTEKEVDEFKKYKGLIELLNKMSSSQSPSEFTKQIYAHAQSDIDTQISLMLTNPLIARAEYKRQNYLAKTQMPSAKRTKEKAEEQLHQLLEEQKKLKEKIAVCTKEEAQAKSKELQTEIERIQVIYDDLKITEKINSAKAELRLIKSTISNLETALSREQDYLSQ